MRIVAVFRFVLASLVASRSNVAQIFPCDGADVRIEVVARESRAWEDRVEAVVTVSRDGEETILRYRNIDFIGGQCLAGSDSRPLFIFQAFCGGSGAKTWPIGA